MVTSGQLLFLVIIGWMTLLSLASTVKQIVLTAIYAKVYEKIIESGYLEPDSMYPSMVDDFIKNVSSVFKGAMNKKEDSNHGEQ